MSIATRYLLLGALLAATGNWCAMAGDVYKTVDAQGHVTYSDRSLGPTSRKVSVDVIEGNPREAARMAKEQAAVEANAAEQAKLAAKQAADEQKQQAKLAEQQRKCEAARTRYGTFAAGGRIFHYDDQGERSLYSDQEIEAERASAKAEMDAACTS